MGVGVLAELDDLQRGAAGLLEAGVRVLVDDDLHAALEAVDRLRRTVHAIEIQVVAEIDIRGSHEDAGAKTAAAYAAWKLPMSLAEARGLVRASRWLRKMPLIADAFYDDRLTTDQVRLYAACQQTNPDAFADAEAVLLQHAFDLDHHQLVEALTYWRQCADPDGSQTDAERRYAKRDVSLVQAPDGMWLLKGQQDAIGGEIFGNALETIRREEFDQDWALAKAEHGDDTCMDHLRRTDPQRRADALVVMARRAAMVTPGSEVHGPRPLITVLVGEDTLRNLCETEGGTILDPNDLWRIVGWADFERVVFDSRSRVMDVSVRTRLFTGATRRASQVRERECGHPSCHEPVTYADIHHVEHFEDGGETIHTNGSPRCKWHHRHEHRQPPPAA
jgi:hypothetical protein